MSKDYIGEYERRINQSWASIFLKILVAVILLVLVFYSVIPVKMQIEKYNGFVQVGNCLCPANNYGWIK